MAPAREAGRSLLTRCYGCCSTTRRTRVYPHPKEEQDTHFILTESWEETFEKIKKRCLGSKTLYEDPDFPASARVLFRSGPYYGVKWKRPKEISGQPVYIQDGAVYYDMDQGSVGNCWFIASVCCVAASPQQQIMSRVVPKDQGFGADYCGAFRFYFWQYGKWVEVVVDDRLPTYNNRLIYSSNNRYPNEYWCPLLEKAFAKLHGNYDVLDGGRVHSSLVDLTGGLGEMLPLRDEITDKELENILINCQNMNSIMGAAIFNRGEVPGEREVKKNNGLYEGHAYTVVKVKQVRTRHGMTTLLHLRNPWGSGEWNGAWSDGSAEWNMLSRDDRESTFRTRDNGEFWISVSDFRQNFDELELCHLTPDGLTEEIASNLDRSQWQITEHYGSWVEGISAGGPPVSFTSRRFWSNPQFELSIPKATKPTTVVISLFEIENLLSQDTGDISIGFVIFKHQEGKKPNRITAENFYQYTPRLIETSGLYWPYRERTLRYVMEPGDHVIVPCTYKAGQEAEFYMRVFAEQELVSNSIDQPDGQGYEIPMSPKDMSDRAIDKTFDNIAGNAGVIDAADLVEVFKSGLKAADSKHEGLKLETCRCLVGLANIQSSKGLIDREGVRKVWADLENWRKAFRIIDKDKNNFVDATELQKLFKIIDFNAGPDTVEAIMKRYGGKRGLVSEEDFLQSFCKSLQQYRTFRQLETDKKVNMTLNEWMSVSLKT